MDQSNHLNYNDNIFIIIGSATFMLISHFYKLWLKKNYKKFKNSKIFSVNEFFKHKKELNNPDVIVIGKYFKDYSIQNSETFNLMNHSSNFLGSFTKSYLKISPEYLYIFNARKGNIEKNLINFNFVYDIFSFFLSYRLFHSLNLSFFPEVIPAGIWT